MDILERLKVTILFVYSQWLVFQTDAGRKGWGDGWDWWLLPSDVRQQQWKLKLQSMLWVAPALIDLLLPEILNVKFLKWHSQSLQIKIVNSRFYDEGIKLPKYLFWNLSFPLFKQKFWFTVIKVFSILNNWDNNFTVFETCISSFQTFQILKIGVFKSCKKRLRFFI